MLSKGTANYDHYCKTSSWGCLGCLSPSYWSGVRVMEVAHPFLQQLHIPFLVHVTAWLCLVAALSPKSNPVKWRCLQREKYTVVSCHWVSFLLYKHKLQKAKKFSTATLSLVHEIRKKKISKHFWKGRSEWEELVILTRWVGEYG